MPTTKPIWFLFVTSVWLFVVLNGYRIAAHLLHADQIIGAYPGGYDFKVFVAPFFLLGLELFLWFQMFRWQRHPARIFAGIVGGYIWLMVILVGLLVADVYDKDQNAWVLLIYGYAGIGHLAYAFLGKEPG